MYYLVVGNEYLKSPKVQSSHAVQVGGLRSLPTLSVCLFVRMATLPENPVAIDWSYYKSTVAKAGMVDEFEKKVCTSISAPSKLRSISSKASILLHSYGRIIIYVPGVNH